MMSNTKNNEKFIRLKPKIPSYSITLNAHNRYFCRYYPSALMVFKGCIDTQRFSEAIESALQYFPFLFGKLKDDGMDLQIAFENNSGSVICEYATYPHLSYTEIHESTAMHLPQHLPANLFTMPEDVNGLIMLQLRVTECADGFAFGYTFNHACLDQASLLYFFKYLVAFYNRQNANDIAAPNLLDTFSLLKSPGENIDFDAVACSIGRIEKTRAKPLPVVDYEPIQIIFKKDRMREYCKPIKSQCSSNAIINAFLIKIYALQEERALSSEFFSIEMAANCRKKLGLSDATIGNIVATVAINHVPITVAKSATLLELASMIRQHVNAYTPDNFLTILHWYHQSSIRNNSERYIAEYLVNPSIMMTTNWQGFDYSSIQFEDSQLLAILQPPQPFYRLFLGVITFDNRVGNQIILSCQIPKDILDKTHALCREYADFIEC